MTLHLAVLSTETVTISMHTFNSTINVVKFMAPFSILGQKSWPVMLKLMLFHDPANFFGTIEFMQ